MMIRTYATTLIIWASLLIGELHTFWENSTRRENWILTKSVVMPMQWNVKYATDQAWFILMAFAIYLYLPNRINRTTALAYALFCIADTFMYFYNYKQEGYGWVYTFLLITWIIIYNHGSRRTTNRQGIVASA